MRIFASIVAVVALAGPIWASKAADVYREAEKQEKSGRIVEAYLLYAEASALEPANRVYRAKIALMRPRADKIQAQTAAQIAARAAAAAATAEPAEEDASRAAEAEAEFEAATSFETEKARQALPPAKVKLPTGHFDFHINGDAKEVFNQIAQRCGLQTQFDSEYDKTPLRVRFDIEDVDCRDALRAAESATNSFIVPYSSKLILISKDTAIKRKDNEQTMSVVVPIPTAITPQDLTEISQAVKQVTGIEKLAFNAASNEIVIRDRVSRVIPAMALLEQLTAYRGNVVIELRFLQLDDSDVLTYGVNLTNSFSLIWGGDPNIAAAGGSLQAVFKALQQGWQGFGITALQASVVANLTKSTAKTILQMQINAVSGMPSTLHVGEKYPVLTSAYVGSTATSNQGAYTPPPSFDYMDLGVSLKILPVVCSSDLVTLDVQSEYQLLGGQALDGIPILANRTMSTRISIHNEEWALIGGLMQETKLKGVTGVAGLSRIPLLGWLFKTENRETDHGHIVILMKPHITGDPPGNRVSAPMRVGTDTRPLSPL